MSFLPESNGLFKESEIISGKSACQTRSSTHLDISISVTGIAEKPIGDPFTIPFVRILPLLLVRLMLYQLYTPSS
jgi:hypothetical protein